MNWAYLVDFSADESRMLESLLWEYGNSRTMVVVLHSKPDGRESLLPVWQIDVPSKQSLQSNMLHVLSNKHLFIQS